MRVAAILLCLVAAGCGKKQQQVAKADAAPMAQPGQPGQPGKITRQPKLRQKLGVITAEEATALLPLPAGAESLAAAAKTKVGERIEQQFCLDGELAAVGAALVAHYQGAGWEGVQFHENPQIDGRGELAGRKSPYSLFGRAEKGVFDDCDGNKGRVRVTVGVHKLVPLERDRGGLLAPGRAGGAGGAGNLRVD